jgi:hypothetical protein
MLIDLGRNDVGRVAEPGSVEVGRAFVVERYSHVMHIVSEVQGRLRAGSSFADVLKATFPAGTVSGAPKIRALEVIRELEPVKRNIYSGAVGYVGWWGDADTAIAIRTAVIQDGRLHVQAGAGIVTTPTRRRSGTRPSTRAARCSARSPRPPAASELRRCPKGQPRHPQGSMFAHGALREAAFRPGRSAAQAPM